MYQIEEGINCVANEEELRMNVSLETSKVFIESQ